MRVFSTILALFCLVTLIAIIQVLTVRTELIVVDKNGQHVRADWVPRGPFQSISFEDGLIILNYEGGGKTSVTVPLFLLVAAMVTYLAWFFGTIINRGIT